MTYTFKLRGKTYSAPSIAEASAIYGKLRDDSGEGCSTFPTPVLRSEQGSCGKFSYNGRLWNGETIVYDNRIEA